MTDPDYLNEHRAVWQAKPVLRRLYRDQFYAPLVERRAPGSRSLEVGSGPGFLAEFDPSVWRTDVLPGASVHCRADAHRLPFRAGSFDNVIGLDVLHHLARPVPFLREAARVLRSGGRLILVEPWLTPLSRFVYAYLHQEDCYMDIEPWREDRAQFRPGKMAFDGNAAIPYVLVKEGGAELARLVPQLALQSVERFSSLTYLLSLGFKRASLLPEPVYPWLYRLERATRPIWERLAALRALLVWEKNA